MTFNKSCTYTNILNVHSNMHFIVRSILKCNLSKRTYKPISRDITTNFEKNSIGLKNDRMKI